MACRSCSRGCVACTVQHGQRPRRSHSAGSLELPKRERVDRLSTRHWHDWTEAYAAPAPERELKRLQQREALLQRRLRCWLRSRGRRQADSLAWAALNLWAQNAKERRLSSAVEEAAKLRRGLRTSELEQACARMQLRCLLLWRARVQVHAQEDQRTFLLAHLESSERCVFVLEAWTRGLEVSLLRVFHRAWASLLLKPAAKAIQLASSRNRSAGLRRSFHLWVERQRCMFRSTKHCQLLEKALGHRQIEGLRSLLTLWRHLALCRGRERALRLQHQQQQRRRQRQMLAMLLKTRGLMLQRLSLCAWRMFLSFQGKEERRSKLDLMLQKALGRSRGGAFGAWKSHVALLRQALAQQRRSVLAAAFRLWKEQGAEALKEEFNDLWLKAVLLAARPLKSEDLARFRVGEAAKSG